jgi:2'-phosphotransferase
MTTLAEAPHPLPLTKTEKQLARYLTQLLRHGKPRKLASLRPDGFATLAEIQTVPGFSGLTVPLCHAIVAEDNKQRFAFRREEPDAATGAAGGAAWWLRANQGHTVAGLDPDLLLTRVDDPSQLPCVVHGTYRAAWPAIQAQGLCRMKRNHVHFASGLPSGGGAGNSGGVVSGMRASAEVLVYVNAAAAMALGVIFFVSANGVILTPGIGPQGVVPPAAFEKVVDVATGADLLLGEVASGSSARASSSSAVPAAVSAAEEAPKLAGGESASANAFGKHKGGKGGKGHGKGNGGLFLPGKGGGKRVGNHGGKATWPEVVGLPGDEAVAVIKAAAPGLQASVVPVGAMVTMDHRLDRVRVYVGADGKVAQPPKLG